MTEAEWLASCDPTEMLQCLRGKNIGRPLSLLAVACCRAQRDLMRDERSHRAVEWAERLIDGRITLDDEDGPTDGDCYLMATGANRCMSVAGRVAMGKVDEAIESAKEVFECLADTDERKAVRRLRTAAKWARCVFGNPFRRFGFDPAWREWDGGTCLKLAAGIDADRAFGRLPILSDALEEAGFTDDAVLSHLRSPSPHVRGCWALDLSLGNGEPER